MHETTVDRLWRSSSLIVPAIIVRRGREAGEGTRGRRGEESKETERKICFVVATIDGRAWTNNKSNTSGQQGIPVDSVRLYERGGGGGQCSANETWNWRKRCRKHEETDTIAGTCYRSGRPAKRASVNGDSRLEI